MTDFLSRDQILQPRPVPSEEVYVPLWGGKVLVYGLTGKERDQFEQALVTGKGRNRDVRMTDARAKLLVLSVRDQQGQRLFSDSDIGAISAQPAMALEPVFSAAMRLAGLKEEDIDELGKASENGQSDASISGLPLLSDVQ